MRILDLLKRRQRQLVLDDSSVDKWPQEITEQLGLDEEFKRFSTDLRDLHLALQKALAKLKDDGVLSAVPDRARTMNTLHAHEYVTQCQKLLVAAQFTDLFTFEQEQEKFFEVNSTFKDLTAKNVSVLKEFLHDELKQTQMLLQQQEDRIIAFTKLLEERKFPEIRKIHDSQQKLKQSSERSEKYSQLLISLQSDLKRTQEKKAKIEEDIRAQEALVRNQDSMQALQKMRKLEENLHKVLSQYSNVATDCKTLCKKDSQFKLEPQVKQVIEELAKDPGQFLAGHAEEVQGAFDSLVSQLEERRNVRSLIERLTRLAKSAEADGRMAATAAPDIRQLKREVMRDIAALQIYDKMQFLMRAQVEEETISGKISFVTSEMDPNKRAVLEQEIKSAARSLGATIKSELNQ